MLGEPEVTAKAIKTKVIGKIAALREFCNFGNKRRWYEDLCEYYGVTPQQAGKLGSRSASRRPDLPTSSTTKAVSDMTMTEIWESKPRNTAEEIYQWQKDLGAWSAFRQCYYHRYDRFDWLVKDLPSGSKYCEYACGSAPICNWIVENVKDRVFHFTTVDVDCEHRTFGEWRLRRRIERSGRPFTLQPLVVKPNAPLPLTDRDYDVITVIEALVLIHNPLEVVRHITEHIRKGGKLWETYTVMDDHRTKNWTSFRQAQQQRPAVFDYIHANYKLLEGPDPDTPGDAGRRCWEKL
jgi:ubiquinone/menaquinone biosynthesis C-methylase UbiE